MNEAQERQALIALAETAMKKMEAEQRAKRHFDAVEAVTKYNLPYKVYFKTTFADDEIPINPFYPYPAVPLAGKWEWHHSFATKSDFWEAITEHTGKYDENGKEYCHIGIDCADSVQKMKEDHERPFAPWNLETEEGIRQWERYFTRFLLPFEKDIKKWKAFDFFGTSDHTEAEAEAKRKYYLKLISDCKKNPEKYELEPPKKKAEDFDQYDVGLFYLDDMPEELYHDNETAFLKELSEMTDWKNSKNIH